MGILASGGASVYAGNQDRSIPQQSKISPFVFGLYGGGGTSLSLTQQSIDDGRPIHRLYREEGLAMDNGPEFRGRALAAWSLHL